MIEVDVIAGVAGFEAIFDLIGAINAAQWWIYPTHTLRLVNMRCDPVGDVNSTSPDHRRFRLHLTMQHQPSGYPSGVYLEEDFSLIPLPPGVAA